MLRPSVLLIACGVSLVLWSLIAFSFVSAWRAMAGMQGA